MGYNDTVLYAMIPNDTEVNGASSVPAQVMICTSSNNVDKS
jgi:hypothetical protein